MRPSANHYPFEGFSQATGPQFKGGSENVVIEDCVLVNAAIRGRGRKLYLNYRTTEEIRRAAVALLEGCEVNDLDEGSDEVKKYNPSRAARNPRSSMRPTWKMQ